MTRHEGREVVDALPDESTVERRCSSRRVISERCYASAQVYRRGMGHQHPVSGVWNRQADEHEKG